MDAPAAAGGAGGFGRRGWGGEEGGWGGTAGTGGTGDRRPRGAAAGTEIRCGDGVRRSVRQGTGAADSAGRSQPRAGGGERDTSQYREPVERLRSPGGRWGTVARRGATDVPLFWWLKSSFARARLRLGLRGGGAAARGPGPAVRARRARGQWGAGRRNEVESGERNMSVAVLGCHRQRGRARSRGANFRRG